MRVGNNHFLHSSRLLKLVKVKYRSDSDVSELVVTSLAMLPAKFALLRNSDKCYRAMSVFAYESPELLLTMVFK